MNKRFIFIMGMICAIYSAHAQQPVAHLIGGVILTAEKGTPLDGALILAKKSQTEAITDARGHFSISINTNPDTLIIRHIGYHIVSIPVSGKDDASLTISLQMNTNHLQEVVVSTGYQQIPQERATGAFDFIDNKLINRSVGSAILSRIENLTPGLLFNHGDAANSDNFLIRGRSTIYSSAQPLIVLDNFPYDGDINNINPNDIECITILKDAAAASIWGARAGNGVIVITTKMGKSIKPRIEFNSNITISQQPDLFNIKSISSPDYINLEEYLYSKKYYQYILSSPSHPPVTPVIELLDEESRGIISPAQANAEIDQFKKKNALSDIGKYLYRKGAHQQYALNVSGNTPIINYFMSVGMDKDYSSLVGMNSDRITLRSQNTFNVSKNLQLLASINYVQSNSNNGNNPGYNLNSGAGKGLYPYAGLVNEKGNPTTIVRDYRQSWADTVGDGSLLNWEYNPIEDISDEKNTSKTNDYVINAGLNYNLNSHLKAEIKYQYENEQVTGNDFYNSNSYFARNLINRFTQVDPVTGLLSYPVPQGGILDKSATEVISHQGRVQLNYNQSWGNSLHQVAAIAGWEIKSMTTQVFRDRLYGYNPDQSSIETNMDYITYFPLYYYPVITSSITNGQFVSGLVDRFISYYANASYTFHNRYIFSASGRTDAANLFGVKANQKGVPLWSAGYAWIINNEPFYSSEWLPYLKLRITYGYNGNFSRLASAYTTATVFGANTTPAMEALIMNPPNENLTWEKIGTTNIGIDFRTKNNILFGSVAYYRKKASNLIGQAAIDPTLGLSDNSGNSFFYTNVAAMQGSGIDLELNSHVLNGRQLKWQTTFLFSYTSSKVTKYIPPLSGQGLNYVDVGKNYINPVKGNPLFSLYSYRWEGLDPATGDPRGELNKSISEDYANILASTTLDEMVYNGPAEPVYFGAWRNTIQWKNISLSFNISYKLGYFFRRPSVNYSNLFSSWTGSSDYAKRWQKPGDENKTNVPSLVYPDPYGRDAFYQFSQTLVDNAGNIRLEDIRLSYQLNKKQWKLLPSSGLEIYLYANNLGILWEANKDGIDPYYVSAPKIEKSISLGIHFSF